MSYDDRQWKRSDEEMALNEGGDYMSRHENSNKGQEKSSLLSNGGLEALL
jgi:hypothetical protein